MVALPPSQHTTAAAVLRWRAAQPQEHRAHLGASVLGHACDRHIWYLFRNAQASEFEGRMLRLFDRGKREEATVYQELRGIGVELHADEHGKQIDCRDASGHIGGSVDGVGRGFPEAPKSWAVLEIKTHSSKSFKILAAKGVCEAKPAHYAQMQIYMGLMQLPRALYFGVNKDTDELHTEWVHFERGSFDALMERGHRLVDAKEPPQRLSEDPAYWTCKGCQHYNVCHQEHVPEANCRTCCHATPVENGAWSCGLHNKQLDRAEQLAGCAQHLFIPALIPYAQATDAGDGYVEYQHQNGEAFRNGAGGFGSRELVGPSKELIVDTTLKTLRAFFDAKVVATDTVPAKRGRRSRVDLSNVPEFKDDDLADIRF